MKIESLMQILDSDFYTGIPDSQLKAFCDYLMYTYGIDKNHHIIAANEGNCVALAAGYHLSTGKTPVVYLQNSGEGNIINPIASLLNENVYAIPMIFVVGWRGEPNTKDEPQHIYQGKVTLELLETMDIKTFIISKDTTEYELSIAFNDFKDILSKGKQVAFIVKKDALNFEQKVDYKNENKLLREDIIKQIVKYSEEDPIISTTGKASRELFETRKSNNQNHKYDFLTVGSMGHTSSIALGIAINKPKSKVWCIDGDGSVLMHMGSMALIGTNSPKNLVHIIINNASHETVGGMPTVSSGIDFIAIAKACGYKNAICVEDFEELNKALKIAKTTAELFLIEVKCSVGSRKDLGRPTTTALENKINFMNYLKEK